MTTKEITAMLGVDQRQLRRIMDRNPAGFFDYMGRRFSFEKTSNGFWHFEEIERPSLDTGSDLVEMDISELKRQKAISEVRLLRQKEDAEIDRIRAEVLMMAETEFKRRLHRLGGLLRASCTTPAELKVLVKIIEEAMK